MAFVRVLEWDKIYDLYDAGLLWGAVNYDGPCFYLPPQPTGMPATRIRKGMCGDKESYGYMTED